MLSTQFEPRDGKRKAKPAVPGNVQALITENDLRRTAIQQAELNQRVANETKFREEHAGIVHNAEVMRNARAGLQEADYTRLESVIERREKLRQLYEAEQAEWKDQLQGAGLAIWDKPPVGRS